MRSPLFWKIIAWGCPTDSKSWVEIAQGKTFDNAIRIATDGTAFDVVSRAGDYSCHAAEAEGEFISGFSSWTSAESAPRQVASNGNGRADVFFATVSDSDKPLRSRLWNLSPPALRL